MHDDYTNEVQEQLNTLADNLKPETRFASHLEMQLLTYKEPKTMIRSTQRWLLNSAAAILILFVFVTAVPPLRTFAQELIDRLFNQLESDQTTYTYSTLPTVVIDQRTTFESVAAAEQEKGMDIVEATFIPEGYDLTPVTASASQGLYFAMQSYIETVDNQLLELDIMQSDAALDWGEAAEIGANAEVQTVEFTWGEQTIQAAYVEGIWFQKEITQQNNVVTKQLEWDSTVNLRRLRWQYGDQIYQLGASGGTADMSAYVDLDTLVAIAESMYPAAEAANTTTFTSLETAKAAVGDSLLAPEAIPTPYALARIYTQNDEYQLLYQTNGSEMLITRKTPGSTAGMSNEVGASATIETVPLQWQGQELTAEYVAGAWMSEAKSVEVGTIIERGAWNNTAPVRRLRWQTEDFVYEILVTGLPGEQDFTAQDLAGIAASMN